MKRSEIVEIDLSKLSPLFYNIDANVNYELELIKCYSYHVDSDSNTITSISNKILSDIYREENGSYKELEISKFFKIARLNDKIERFLEVVEFRILNKVDPTFEQIKFKEDLGGLKISFEVWYE